MNTEYPKTMQHPSYRAAIVSMTNPRSAMFPDVSVGTLDDEEYYRAQGYHVAGEIVPPYEHQEYPKWVNGVMVENEDDELALVCGDEAPVKRSPGRPRKIQA